MKCSGCKKDFPQNQLDLSHDVPKYAGGTDKDRRHYLCKKCHDIYERMVYAVMITWLPEETKVEMRRRAKNFAKMKFKEGGWYGTT